MTGTEVLKLGESGITAHLQLLSLQCSDSPERHITKFSVVTLQQADAPLLIIIIIIIVFFFFKKSPQIEWRMCGTYLVFMPSSIFEFRRAVHDSPSVIYHHTKNRRIESACVSGRQGISPLFLSLYLRFSLLHEKEKWGYWT